MLNLKKLKAVRYVYTGMICEAFDGPPLVMVYTRSNWLNVQIISNRTVVMLTSLMPVSVIWRKLCQTDAPSTRAAS